MQPSSQMLKGILEGAILQIIQQQWHQLSQAMAKLNQGGTT